MRDSHNRRQLMKALWVSMSQQLSRRFWVKDKDGEYRVSATARGNGELPVLFINGIGDTQNAWDSVIAVQPEGTTFITYNRAGLGDSTTGGKSDPRPNLTQPRSYGELADEARQVMDGVCHELRGDFLAPVVVGHSFGANIARAFALKKPTSREQPVSGLLLVDGSTDKVLGKDAQDALRFRYGLVPDNVRVEDQGAQFPPEVTWIDTNRGVEELAYDSYPRVPTLVLARNPGWSWEAGVDISRKRQKENLATGQTDHYSAPYQKYLHDCKQWTVHQLIQASILCATYIGTMRRKSGSESVKIGHRVHAEAPETVISALDLVVKAVQNGQSCIRDDDAWNAYVKTDAKYPCTVLSQRQVAEVLEVVPNELLRLIQVGEPVEIPMRVRALLEMYPPFAPMDYQKDRQRYPTDQERSNLPWLRKIPKPEVYHRHPPGARMDGRIGVKTVVR